MIRMRSPGALFCAAALGLVPAIAQAREGSAPTLQDAIGDPDDITVTGSLRVRYEALDNQFRPGLDDHDDIVLLRTTLAAEYHPGPVRVGAEVQDSRAYDTDSGEALTTSEVNALELVQAYVGFELGDALGSGTQTSVTAGRFTMDLGSRRLVARNNFRNTTNTFTGFKARIKGLAGGTLDAFYTLPDVRLPADRDALLHNEVHWDRASFDLTFWGAHYALPLPAGTTLEAYFYGLDENDSPTQATRNRHLRTPGLRLLRKPAAARADFELEGAWQFGHVRSGTAVDAARLGVAAWFVHATLGYTLDAPWSPRIAVEYDRASGDDGHGTYNRFDTLFGARRSEYGPTSIFGLLGRANISSPGVRLEANPGKRWDAMVMYRAAWLDSASDSFASSGVRDGAGAAGTFAGQQVEARVRYWLVPGALRLDTGAAAFFNGRFLRDAANANDYGNPLYGYAEVTASF